MRYLITVFLFAMVAMVMFGCATAPVQQPQDIWTKFLENTTKNLDSVNKKLDEAAKEQAEMGDTVEKLQKLVDSMKLIDTEVLKVLFDQMKLAMEFGRTTKEQGQ